MLLGKRNRLFFFFSPAKKANRHRYVSLQREYRCTTSSVATTSAAGVSSAMDNWDDVLNDQAPGCMPPTRGPLHVLSPRASRPPRCLVASQWCRRRRRQARRRRRPRRVVQVRGQVPQLLQDDRRGRPRLVPAQRRARPQDDVRGVPRRGGCSGGASGWGGGGPRRARPEEAQGQHAAEAGHQADARDAARPEARHRRRLPRV